MRWLRHDGQKRILWKLCQSEFKPMILMTLQQWNEVIAITHMTYVVAFPRQHSSFTTSLIYYHIEILSYSFPE